MKSKVLIAGASGMVGRALVNELEKNKNIKLLKPTRDEVNYLNYIEVENYFKKNKPDYVYIVAAKVGGILANAQNKIEFFEDNQIIQINLFKCIQKFKVKKSVFLGSSCIYPKTAEQPIKENQLLNGRLEETNEGYALAKISGVRLARYYKEKYSTNIICPMMCNIYGTNDNFDFGDSHVLSALVRRFIEAKDFQKKNVLLWGSGSPRREFIHVSDAAKSLIFLMEKYNEVEPINVGSGYDLSIKDLAHKISKIVGYTGEIDWAKTKPDGVPRKLLDISKLNELGFKSVIGLDEGIKKTVEEFRDLKRKNSEIYSNNKYSKNSLNNAKNKDVYNISHSNQINKNYWYPLSLPTYDDKEVKQALDSMKNFKTTMWDKTLRFEKKFSKKVKSKYSVMVNSGSSSDLLMSFSLIDKNLKLLKPGDEVIIPILTWPTHIWSAMMAGLKVRLVDIDINTLNIDLNELKKNISKKTKAIFIVHALGNPCNMDEINRIAKKNNLLILEDCCEALGSKYAGKFVGNFGLAGSYSFFFSHHITTMEGGMIVTNDKKIFQNLKYLRSHGWKRDISSKKKPPEKKIYKKFEFVNWGFNVRPTELQAGFGIEQLKKLNKFNSKRKKYFEIFKRNFKNNSNIYFPKVEKKSDPSWFSIPIIFRKNSGLNREKFIEFLEKKGIESRPIIVGNLTRHPVAKTFKEFKEKKFPNADYIHKNGLYIGLNPMISEFLFKKMIDTIKSYFKN